MKYLRYTVLAALVLAAGVFSGCKSDEDDTSLTLNGSLTFDMPTYVHYGDVYHLEPTLITRSEDETDMVGYKFYNSLTATTDTLRLEDDDQSVGRDCYFEISVDTLGSFTATYTAFADGYYSKTSSRTFYIVKDGLNEGTLTGFDLDNLQTFTDDRDGLEYYYTDVNGVSWMAQDLAWSGSGVALGEEDAMSYIYGRYYTWDEAQEACPDGWHLPAESDWVALATAAGASEASELADIEGVAGALMVDALFNDEKMWEFWPEVKITNSLGFSAIPTGYAVISEGENSFTGASTYETWWTATEYDDDNAIVRYIVEGDPDLHVSAHSKTGFAASVRCIK